MEATSTAGLGIIAVDAQECAVKEAMNGSLCACNLYVARLRMCTDRFIFWRNLGHVGVEAGKCFEMEAV